MSDRDPARVAQGLYLTLDALYDTRLATLEEIHPKLVPLVLKDNYMTRVEDAFPMVSKHDFEKLYALRDTATLERALPTGVFRFIDEFIKQSAPQCVDNPWNEETQIYVNVQPYKIDRITAQNMLAPLLAATGNVAHVNILNMPDEQLTPFFCRQHFGVMVMYDYQHWLDTHARLGNFPKQQIPNVKLVAPRLYEAKVPTDEEMREMKRIGQDPFKAAMLQACGLIGLEYADIDSFCADLSPADFARITMTE